MRRRINQPIFLSFRTGLEFSNSDSGGSSTDGEENENPQMKPSKLWRSALKSSIIIGTLISINIAALPESISSSQAQSLGKVDLGLVEGMKPTLDLSGDAKVNNANANANASANVNEDVDLKVDVVHTKVVLPIAIDHDSNNSRHNPKLKAKDVKGHSNYTDTTVTDQDMAQDPDPDPDPDPELDHGLYEQVYSSYQEAREGPRDGFQFTNDTIWELEELESRWERRLSLETYGKHVLEGGEGCDITVLFTDPRIPSETKQGSTASFALESVANFLPQACVIIQTSKCKVEEAMAMAAEMAADSNNETETDDESAETDDESAERVIYHMLYQMSLPLFQKMIDEGRVRVTFLDHEKYHLRSCSDFFNPSAALMNINFWGDDEFIADVDSDTVLVMQNDSVLCHGFDVDVYRKYAMVGGGWHPYACNMLLTHWNMYLRPQLRGGKMKMEFALNSKFPEICNHGDEKGPLGNGGFSLRSRSAMRKAIETCPHSVWSGIDTSHRNLPCVVEVLNEGANVHAMHEDVYFGTVLRATNASLPTAFVASLFAVEMSWPDQTIDSYGGPSDRKERERLAKEASCTYHDANGVRWGQNEKAELKNETVPIGFHQPYVYHSKESLMSQDVKDHCPLLQYMYDPLFKRSYT